MICVKIVMVIWVNLLDKIISSKKNTILFIIGLALISSFTLLIIPNISRGHDLAFHLSRIAAIKDNLKLGIIGGEIYPNYLGGYGYANPLFYPDLFLYIPALLSYMGLSVITSYKIFLLLISFGSILNMFICVKGITNNKKAALISSVIYGFASYRLVDMFTRAALGETLAFVFAPLVIYGIYEIIYGTPKKFYILMIGMSGLILSHLISTYLIGIVLIIICLINIKKLFGDKKRIGYLCLAAMLTFLLTSFYLVPMLEQMIDGSFYFNNLNETSKLLDRSLPIWSLFLEFPYHIFTNVWIPTGIGIGFIVLVYYYFKNLKKCSIFEHICFILSLFLMVCMTNIFPWQLFQNILSPIQFPWRFYFLIILLLSIGGGVLFSKISIDLNKTFRNFFIICLIPVISIGILNFFEQNIKEVGNYEISFGEYMPEKANKDYILSRGDVITTTFPLTHKFTRNGLTLNISFSNNEFDNSLELPLLYYKGYRAILNGKDIDVYSTDNGLVGLNIGNVKNGKLNVYYHGTTVQNISRIVSFTTLIILLMILFYKKRGEKNEK